MSEEPQPHRHDSDGKSGSFLLGLYKAFAHLLVPLAPLILRYRLKQGKEHPHRLMERKGMATENRLAGALVWVHAASVGEFNTALPVIRRLCEQDIAVLVTTVTQTSASLADQALPDGALHQFVPLDIPAYLERFLETWRPDLALFMESEIWPVTLSTLSDKAIPLIFVNGRLSQRSFKGWSRFQSLARRLFSTVDLVLAQSPVDAERFASLGAQTVVTTGNIKFDRKPPEADQATLTDLQDQLGERPCWLAASTHAGEEEEIARAHDALIASYPDLLTVIVPRHPERGNDLARALGRDGARPIALRSRQEAMPEHAGLYIADTLGELGHFYRLAPVSFIGGSLIEHGGQNPIEAVQLDSLVVHGPHIGNFRTVYSALGEARACVRIESADTLAETVDQALKNPSRSLECRTRANEVILQLTGALDRTMQALRPYLDRLS